VTVWPLGLDRETVKFALTVPDWPSVTVTSSTESDGKPSSSTIVPVPWPSAIVALTAVARLTTNASFASSVRSPLTVTLTVFVVSPAAKESDPLVAA
jgi:hypothetical protein